MEHSGKCGKSCPTCRGSGKVMEFQPDLKKEFRVKCRACNGLGRILA
jgi:DnaJ-class molecular chaperone